MVKRMYGEFRLKNGGKIYVPPHVEAAPGFGAVRSDWEDIDVFDVHTVQRYAIGTLFKQANRTYAYCEFGGTSARGEVMSAEAPVTAHELFAAVATDAGVNTFEVSSPNTGSDDIIENEYSGGVVGRMVNGVPGELYDILSHDAVDISEILDFTVTLIAGQKTGVALAATDDLSFVKNPWKEVIVAAAALTAATVGISIGIGADGSFGWLGVKGPHLCLTEGTLVAYEGVRPSETDAGSVAHSKYDEADDMDLLNIGQVAGIFGADDEMTLVNLNGFNLV